MFIVGLMMMWKWWFMFLIFVFGECIDVGMVVVMMKKFVLSIVWELLYISGLFLE